MAITKIHPIRRTLNKAVKYITNPAKTEEEMYVSTFGCSRESLIQEFDFTRRQASYSGSTLAQHIIQSFPEGEVSAEIAHQIGKELVAMLTDYRNEYIIATHLDKGHIHNHIIFNQVNFVDHTHFRSNMKTVKQLRQLSDEICESYGLSVIKEPQAKGMSYFEWQMNRAGKSYKKKLRDNIDRVILLSDTYENFLENMKAVGYEVKQGKYDSFRFGEQDRFTRAKTLGIHYTKEAITERIRWAKENSAGAVLIKPVEIRRWKYDNSIALIDNYHNLMLTAEGKYYRQHLAVQDAKKLAATYSFIKEYNISSLSDLDLMEKELKTKQKEVHKEILTLEEKIAFCNEMMKYMTRIKENQTVWDAYVKSHKSDSYREEHRAEVVLYESALTGLKHMGVSYKAIQMAILQEESITLIQQKEALTSELNQLKKENKEWLTVRKNVESLLQEDQKEASKEVKQEVEKT